MIPQAPPLEPRELEEAGSAIEIIIVWGADSVLHVEHLAPLRTFVLGADFMIGEDVLGSPQLPLVLESQGQPSVVVPPGANAVIERDADGEVTEVAELAKQDLLRQVADIPGARSFPLRRGMTARVGLGELTFIVRCVAAGTRVTAARSDEPVWRRARWTTASAAFHLALLGLCYFLPPRSSALSMDRLDTDSRLVKYAIEAHESLPEEIPRWVEDTAAAGGGERAAEDEGEAGARDQPKTRRRLAATGPHEQPMTREQASELASTAGIIGALRAASSLPGSLFSADRAGGSDPVAVMGNILGDSIGASGGFGGLGMIGTGRGGGGDAVGSIGMGGIGTRGRGRGGDGDGDGYGEGAGGYRARSGRIPRIRTGTPDLHGALSKEIIRRTIGRHINEVRYCYESQLIARPDLQGRVSIKFMIAPTGAVMNATIDNSDIDSPKVATCIAAAVKRMTFPAPENGGLVVVTYPFLLSQTGN